jgi:hypothetical protein
MLCLARLVVGASSHCGSTCRSLDGVNVLAVILVEAAGGATLGVCAFLEPLQAKNRQWQVHVCPQWMLLTV